MKQRYFAQLPNMIDDLRLSVFAFRLFAHIRRVCGEHGYCTQGTRTLAKICNMSVGKISASKHELVQEGLIQIRKVQTLGGLTDAITVVDIWEINELIYSSIEGNLLFEKCSQIANKVFTNNQESVHENPKECSSDERKKNITKNNQYKEDLEKKNELAQKKSALVQRVRKNIKAIRSDERKSLLPIDFEITDEMYSWADENCPDLDIELHTELFIENMQDKKSSNWLGAWYGWMKRGQKMREVNKRESKLLEDVEDEFWPFSA